MRRDFLAVSDGSYWKENTHRTRTAKQRRNPVKVGCFPSNSGVRSAIRGEGKPGSQGPSSNQITYPRNIKQQCSKLKF